VYCGPGKVVAWLRLSGTLLTRHDQVHWLESMSGTSIRVGQRLVELYEGVSSALATRRYDRHPLAMNRLRTQSVTV
jgi:hypothetical protein